MTARVVLITGADGGLGSHVTREFLQAGETVVGVSRKIKQSDFDSPTFTALPADMSTSADAKSLVDRVLTRFGRLDVVVHTVGGFAGGKSIAEMDDATFHGMLDVNLNSTFYFLRAVLPAMRKTASGRIIARLEAVPRWNRARASARTAPQKPPWSL